MASSYPYPQTPPSFSGPQALQQAESYCRKLARSHYENFSIASFLIPKSLRQDFYNIYAYCRWSDDLADESINSSVASERLAAWKEQFEAALSSGTSTQPILLALVATIGRHNLSREPFLDLLSAFTRDQTKTRYADDLDLLDYCRGSANPVGRILLQLAKVGDETAIAQSDQICTGLQLVNFCQDMRRDAAMGRIYLPASRYLSSGIDEQIILKSDASRELVAVLRIWVTDSRELFRQGWSLHEKVPAWLSRDVRLFASSGLAICDSLAMNKFDVWSKRPTVSKATKLRLLTRTLVTSRFPKSAYFD